MSEVPLYRRALGPEGAAHLGQDRDGGLFVSGNERVHLLEGVGFGDILYETLFILYNKNVLY